MVLLANSTVQLRPITDELDRENIAYESPREISFFDTQPGRFVTGILRAVCHADDYLAYRLILGARPNIGPTTCDAIASLVSSNNLNYQDIFRRPVPTGIFPTRLLNVLEGARQICYSISAWQVDDQIQTHINNLHQIILDLYGPDDAQKWTDLIAPLPPESKIQEMLDYILAESNEQKENVINDIYSRLQVPNPAPARNHHKVQIMTMHGAKGLSAKVVFVPGLEHEILPGNRRNPYHGLVLEAARMIYVSVTRARAACIISFAHFRRYFGQNNRHSPSRFAQHLNGEFNNRNSGLTDQETDTIITSCNNL